MRAEEFVPPSSLVALWKVELDLLRRFIEVCDKLNLRYFVHGGTLLGAARHKGFIPWYNDVDVLMPRADYDLMWECARNEFSFPYFFRRL